MTTIPTSIIEGKSWTLQHILARNPQSILDVGCGEGTYAALLRPNLPECRFIGLDIWEPYVDEYHLHDLYDVVLIADARRMEFPPVDITIMGDVLEHMAYPDAVAVWNKARAASRMIVCAAIPIIECPQAEYPNPHEQHVHVWNHYLALSLPGVHLSSQGDVIGTYIAPGTRGQHVGDFTAVR